MDGMNEKKGEGRGHPLGEKEGVLSIVKVFEV